MTVIPILAETTGLADQSGLPYRELFAHMREGVAYCQVILEDGEGPDFVYLDVNAAFEALTGLKNVVGKRASEAIPGIRQSDPELLRTYARVARTGVPEKFETFVEVLQLWFSISAYSPRIGFFVAVFDVIIARKRAERALRESEDSLRALFEDAPVPYHEIDNNGNIARVNRTMCDMLGLEASAMIGRPCWDFVIPEERDESRASIGRLLLGTGIAAPIERTFLSRDGAELVFQIHGRIITDAAGNVAGIRSAMIDATETKRLNARLAKERQLLGALMDQSPDHIYFKDTEGHFTLVNAAMARLLGCSDPSQVIGKTDFDFFAPEHAEPAFLDEQDLVQGRVAVVSKEEKETWPDGRETWVHSTKLALSDPSGRIDGTFGISRNITERKRVEESLRESERQLRLAQKLESIGQLAAGIAHEINTPVQYIGDNAQFLSGAFQDLFRVIELQTNAAADPAADVDVAYLRSEIPNAIAQMQEGVDRVATIVRAMKRFSHPGPAEKIPTDIHQLIESTILVSRNEWKYVADLTTEFDAEMPPVPCIAGEFNQVLLNLIMNATHAIADVVKESGGKGAIRISTRRNGDFAEIRVSDTGGGIPVGIRSKVFDPFFTTKAVGKGTGQGLAIAHSVIVQKHRGTIRFESETGKGATFVIQLPLEEGTEEKP